MELKNNLNMCFFTTFYCIGKALFEIKQVSRVIVTYCIIVLAYPIVKLKLCYTNGSFRLRAGPDSVLWLAYVI